MNAYLTTRDQLDLSRAFARYALTTAEVKRDPVLTKAVENKLAKLNQINLNLRLSNDSQR
jgi:hypothetical protein